MFRKKHPMAGYERILFLLYKIGGIASVCNITLNSYDNRRQAYLPNSSAGLMI